MLYHKTGIPKESEIVLCTVTRVQSHSVFVKLDLYDNKSAMLHISEVSPGRIRNLREYVQEGKVIVCKVLSVNQQRGHIDVSLRRVTEMQRQGLLNSYKQEQKAEKLLQNFCTEKKKDFTATYNELVKVIGEQFEFIHQAFNQYALGEYAFPASGMPQADHTAFLAYLKTKIKPPQVEITGKFKIISYANNGAEIIRDTLVKAVESTDKKQLSLTYGGGGYYNVRIVSEDFKSAEKVLREITEVIEPVFKDEKNAAYEFTRNEGKQLSD